VSLFLAFPYGRSAKNGHLLPWVVLGVKCVLVLGWGVNEADKKGLGDIRKWVGKKRNKTGRKQKKRY